ncbi:glutamine synthetase family protein [Cardiobacteriaceae bacterium TAE3-ERU3]|nr:glutamine synthetase family protein [Cardiobacteriaceae bacterium TAE3-ERU3]
MTRERKPAALYVAACDLNGVWRGKRLAMSQLEKAQGGEVRLPLSILSVDIWGGDVVANALADGDADGLTQPTGRGLLPILATQHPSRLLPVWLYREEGGAYSADPRQALARIVEDFHAEGLTPVIATELEFYLVESHPNQLPIPPVNPHNGQRLIKTDVLSISELCAFDGFLDEVYAQCEAMDIPADSAIAENGCGQFEINLLHCDDPLKAADDALLFKYIVKAAAKRHGFTATFMAKPFAEQSGSGFHIHCSVLDKDGNNIFDDGSDEGTDALRHAVAGLIDSMDDCMLVFAPHFNSYRRLMPGTHAPIAATWGYENRTTAVRIPGGSPKARRIEHRVAGADANPYLVCAAVLGGMLRGLRHKSEPPLAVDGCAYDDDEVAYLPTTWQAAADAFEYSDVARDIFSPLLVDLYAAVKRQEMTHFSHQISQFEYDTYLEDA